MGEEDEVEVCLCPDCDREYEEGEGVTINENLCDEREVCEACGRGYYACDRCGARLSWGNAMHGNDLTLCYSCGESYTTCGDCGDMIHYDYACWDEWSEEYRCESCEGDQRNRLVHRYDHRPYFQMFPPLASYSLNSKWSRVMYQGWELEIDRGDSVDGCAQAIAAIGAPEIYMKEDGSLGSYGIEIVTHPCTPYHHHEELPWKRIIEAARSNGYLSHNTDTCGLHIHVNRTYFGRSTDAQDLGIAKLLILTNNIWDTLVRFSRRTERQLEDWGRKVELGDTEHDDNRELIQKVKDCKYRGRYYAINLENDDTVEFRMMRGTLRYETLMACGEMVEAMCEYAVSNSVKTLQQTNWAKFRATLTNENLLTYCDTRGI